MIKRLPRESSQPLSTTCDFCGAAPMKIIDAPTEQGSWAHMCRGCFQSYGREGHGTVHQNRKAVTV